MLTYTQSQHVKWFYNLKPVLLAVQRHWDTLNLLTPLHTNSFFKINKHIKKIFYLPSCFTPPYKYFGIFVKIWVSIRWCIMWFSYFYDAMAKRDGESQLQGITSPSPHCYTCSTKCRMGDRTRRTSNLDTPDYQEKVPSRVPTLRLGSSQY